MSIQSTIHFLQGLESNNNKDWMDEHKLEYQANRQEFITLVDDVIEQITHFDDTILGVKTSQSLFRINRDIRFSKNKTPYKTHFSAEIKRGGKKSDFAGYYFEIGHNNHVFIGAGIYCPTPKQLLNIRKEIDKNPEEIKKVVKKLNKNGLYLWDNRLKTMPKGFDKNHPNKDLLRYNAWAIWHEEDLLDKKYNDLANTVVKKLKLTKEFVNWLNQTLDK